MGKAGRPPVTRNRVVNYIQRNHPTTVMQIARVMGIDRAQVYRILRAAYGPNFRQQWPLRADTSVDHTGVPLAA